MFSPDVKQRAMVACGRRCALCHKFCGVAMECHHIIPEASGGANSYDNCIPLCFDCHAEVGHYSHSHPKGIKFGPEELRGHRDNWYLRVSTGLPGGTPEEHRNLDRTLALKLVKALGGATYMTETFHECDHSGPLFGNIDLLLRFLAATRQPHWFFFDHLLESAFAEIKASVSDYTLKRALLTFPNSHNTSFTEVPKEWKHGEPQMQHKYTESVEALDRAGSQVWDTFANFVREARTRLLIELEQET